MTELYQSLGKTLLPVVAVFSQSEELLRQRFQEVVNQNQFKARSCDFIEIKFSANNCVRHNDLFQSGKINISVWSECALYLLSNFAALLQTYLKTAIEMEKEKRKKKSWIFSLFYKRQMKNQTKLLLMLTFGW